MQTYTPPPPEEFTATSLGLPHSREAEEAMAGCVLIAPEMASELLDLVKSEDFYVHKLSFVWAAYERLRQKRLPIDNITVSEELLDMGRLEEIGGPAYLTSLLNQVPTTLHAQGYAAVITDNALQRKLLAAANNLATWTYSGRAGDEVLQMHRAQIDQIEQGRGEIQSESLRDYLSAMVDEVQTGKSPVRYIPSGVSRLDGVITGFGENRLYVVAGRPGEGKTSLMLDAARTAAVDHRQSVAFFSLEMSPAELTDRLVSQISGIDSRRIEKRRLMDGEWERFSAAVEQLERANIDLLYRPGLTIPELRQRCLRKHYNMVIVDYLQLMIGESRTRENRVQEISYLSRNLKALAGEIHAPIVCASQMNRQIESRAEKEPQLSDLRDSGSIEQDSDVVIFVYGKENNEDQRKLKVAKQRNGPVGTVVVKYEAACTHFEG
jgi:replicative DNA helicase